MQRSIFKRLYIGFSFIFLFSLGLSAQEANPENGKKLFNANCAACHKLDKKLIGPPLKGISEKRNPEWLKAWIKDNAALRASGDKDAIAIFTEYNGMPMTAFPQLTDQDIIDLVAYTDDKPAALEATVVVGAADPKVALGKQLFQANCAACHKLDKKLIGPALGGMANRRSNEWLKAWIKDNAAFRASGDKDAVAIFNEYNGMPMTAFPQLSDGDIDAVIAYSTAGEAQPADAATTATVLATPRSTVKWITYLVLFVLLAFVVWVFMASNNGFLKIVSTIFVLLVFAYLLFGSLFTVGVDQGYKPIQPIAFSHKIHAGDNKIDCQYCHSSAKHSRHSGIPTVNVCMNCHKSISEYKGKVSSESEKAFYDSEIQKIYESNGWDSEKLAYKENYEQKPIVWTKIHNLPDFVYFNHSQHVTVGGLACQTCHGPVEAMEDMYQFSPLTMGWCIDCHKTTNVDMKNNDYYKKIHEELAKKYNIASVTVADLGGKECGKCHY